MKKILSLLLVLVMLLSLLASCNKEDTPADDTTVPVEDTTADGGKPEEEAKEPEKPDTTLTLASNGSSDYSVWVGQDIYSASPEVRTKVSEFTAKIKEKTKATLEAYGDRYFDTANTDKPAIVIASDKFSDVTPMKGLRLSEYKIEIVGNKLVIHAGGAEGVIDALDYMINNVFTAQETTKSLTLVFKEDHCKGSMGVFPIRSILCLGVELKEYTIVTPKSADINEKTVAAILKSYLEDAYGYAFEKTDDSKAASDHEILIGKTSRTTATPDKNGFIISADNGKLQINADGMLGYENLTDYLRDTLFAKGTNAEYTIAKGYEYKGAAAGELADGTYFVTNRTGDVRVMFYNIYGYIDCGPIAVRQQYQIEMLKAYAPDVLGLQEYSAYYKTTFTSALENIGYTQVQVNDNNNFTPLFYRDDVLDLVDSGFFRYEYTGDRENSKSYTWAIFQTADGKQFAVVNTHFMWNQDGDHSEDREQNARDLSTIINQLGTRNIPVVGGGDLNCNISSEAYAQFANAGLAAAYDKAPESAKNNTNGHHGYATYSEALGMYTKHYAPTGNQTTAIDHAIVTNATNVTGFARLTNVYTQYTSDHSPVLVDISLTASGS